MRPLSAKVKKSARSGVQAGFTLLETMVTVIILVAVGSIVMSGAVQMMKTQGTIANRTEMHTSVRSVTELLEQEIGQAGRVAPPLNAAGTGPENLTLLTAVVASPDLPATVPVSINPPAAVAGLFNGEWLVVDAGQDASGAPKQESVQITCGNPCANPVTATFTLPHNPALAAVPISVQGSFSAGIIPPNPVTPANGSLTNDLKMFGDINGDGTMVYVEYTCLPNGNNAAAGFLYRKEIPWSAPAKPALDNTMILLGNLLPNPNDQNGNQVPCFQYQTKPGPGGVPFVTDVQVTLTVQTQFRDPQTGQFQQETKALLNVSPRNIFNAWEAYNLNFLDRVQPTPPSITPLIPN